MTSHFLPLSKICSNESRRFIPPASGKVWFVNTGDVFEGEFLHSKISDWHVLPGQAKKAIRKHDLLYSEIRPGNGRYAYVEDDFCDAVVSTKFMVLQAKANTLPRYLYHLLTSGETQEVMKQIAESRSGTFPQITFDSISHLEFNIPSLEEQQAISDALDLFEDKIKLNRKTSETLEAMAKALFKSWFVDFDPVRAKAEGRPTGLPQEISDLFPDTFEDSELGEIPSGWKVSELGECSLSIESGRRPKGGIDKNLAIGIPSIGAESIAPVGQFDFSKTKWVEEAFAESSSKGWIRNHDVALYKDGGKPGEFRPRTAFYGDGFPFEKAMVNEHVFLLRSSQLGQPYLYYLFNLDLVLD